MVRRRLEHAARHLHDTHRVLGADELLARRLHVALGAAEAGKNQCLLAGHEVRAIRFDRHVRREPAPLERLGRVLRVGSGLQEVPAESE
jgi:hypothetical protein